MAAKTDNFRISPISGNIWVRNICEIPRYMLFDKINTILILLNCSDDGSQHGSPKLEIILKKMHAIVLQLSAINQN